MPPSFCMKCGNAVPDGAAFCASCGSPVAGAGASPGPSPSGPVPDGPISGPAAPPLAAGTGPPGVPAVTPIPIAPAPPLSGTLGLEGIRKFVLQHESVVGSRVYTVHTHEKRPLFRLREDRGQELQALAQGGAAAALLNWGTPTKVWVLVDSTGASQGRIAVRESPSNVQSMVLDSHGVPLLQVAVERRLGGLQAQAASADGRSTLTAKGNLLGHNFSLHDGSGAEVAKIHEAWASMHDAYGLELTGGVDPVSAVIVAVLIDRERIEQEAAQQHRRPPEPGGLNLRL